MRLLLQAVLALCVLACAPSPLPVPAPALPAPRAGADRIGVEIASLLPQHAARGEAGLAGARATLVRWWTDACPHCEASLPAIEALREEHGGRGFRAVGVYHPKPPRAVEDEEVIEKAGRLGFHGPLLVDPAWSSLKEIWLETGERGATSVSFLLDAEGVVRFVHPGPELFPSDDPAFAQQDADYRAMDGAIRALVVGR